MTKILSPYGFQVSAKTQLAAEAALQTHLDWMNSDARLAMRLREDSDIRKASNDAR